MPIGNVLSGLPVGFVVVGVVFLGLGTRSLIQGSRRRESWPTFPGRVVGSRLDDGQIRSQVSYQRDGRDIVFWNRFTATTTTDPVGREVEVMVNPDDPDDAVVGRGLAGGASVGVAFVVFGAVAVMAGIYLLS